MSYRKPEDFIVNQDLQKEININSEDLNGKNSQDFQRANDPQIELEVEDFLVTFFESKKLISDINLQLLDKSIKPIIIHTHNTVQYYIKKNETSSINQYFNPQNQAGVVSIYPQLNEFDLFAERIQKDAKQINKNQVVIEIPDQDLYRQIQEQNKIQKPQDSLTSQQIKSIREDGTFTVLKRDGVETWEIPESLFLSQKHLRNLRYDSNQKYSEPEIFRFIYSEDTLRRYQINEWEYSYFDKRYLNLLDCLIMLYHIPIHIVNALFGIPLKRVEFNSVPKVIQVKKKIKSILAVRKSQNYDQLIQQLKQQMKKKQKNFQMETILYNIVMNLKWNQKLYEEIQYLKLFLLLSVFEQYFSEIVDPLIEQQEFQQFLKDFKAFFILNYFKKRILNEKEICQSSICHCIYMMRKYNLPEEYEKQYLKVLEIAEQSQNFSPLVEKTVTYYNSDQKEFDDKILRDTYFWKIKQYWINYKACLNDLESCSDQILNSKYGLLVCFSCKENAVSYFIVSGQTYETKYKTICQMFRDIKNRMKTNYLSQFSKNDNEEDDNENDGIFGDCCQRFNCGFYLRNYFCLYFLQGIIYTHILLRLFCFIYIAFYSFICLVIIFSSVFYILIQLIFAFFIYDFTNPSDEKFQKSLVYPKYFPILQILIFYPLLGLIKMVFTIFKSLFYYIAYFRISLRFFPIHLKNFVVFTFIKIFAQIPRRDSSFCKQITKTNQKNKNEQYVRREHFKVNCKLSIEQIKILIMQELNQTRAKSIQEKLGHIVEKKNAKSEKFIENLLKYSPFPNKSNKITELFSQKTTEFYSQIEEMFNQFYSQGFQIELSPNYQFFYDKSELELILGQIIDFLQQLSYQEQKLIDSAFQSLQINKNDYKSLCEYFIVQIFKDYVKSEKKNFESIFKALTSFPVFQEVKNYQISLYSINKYLEINFCKPFESIESFDLQIDNLLNEFQKWNSKNKYFK